MAVNGDRRKRKRVAVHWSVRLFRQPGTRPVESSTENLSSQGLYCISSVPFKPGERLKCEIIIPATLGLEVPVLLECHVTVRRVEYLHDGFGLGCYIEDYAILTSS